MREVRRMVSMVGEMKRRAMFVGPGRSALVAAVEAEKAHDPFGRVLILVPNAATAESVGDDLAAGRALLNVQIQTIENAAVDVALQSGLVLPSGAERLVMRGLLAGSAAGASFRALADSPGFLGALGATLRDLVDAGLRGADLDTPEGSGQRLSELLALARAYEKQRAALELDDDSARFLRATACVKASGAPADCVMLFGLYDATGLQEEFLLALLERAARARVFLAGHAFAAGFRGRLQVALDVEPVLVDDKPPVSQLDWLRTGWDAVDKKAPVCDEDGSVQVFSMPGGEVGAELLARHVAGLLDADPGLAPGDIELVARGTGGLPRPSIARELRRLGVPVRTSAGTLGETVVGRVVLGLGDLLDAPRVTRSRVMDLVSDLPWRAGPLAFGKDGIEREMHAAELCLLDKLGRAADLRVVIDGSSSSTEAGRLLLRTSSEGDRPAARALLAWIDQLADLHKALRAESGPAWGALGVKLARFLEAWLDPQAEGLRGWCKRLSKWECLTALGVRAESPGLVWVLRGLSSEAHDGAVVDSCGVRLGKLAGRRGARARVVILLDGDEGSFPRSRGQNILLGDRERRLLGVRAPGLLADLDSPAEERALFHELCAMATEKLVLVTSRKGIEGGAAAPSRLVIEALGVLAGDALRGAPASEDVAEGKAEVGLLQRFDLEAAWRQDAARDGELLATREGALFGLDAALRAGLSRARAREVLGSVKDFVPPSSAAVEVARRKDLGRSAFDGQLGSAVVQALGESGRFRGTQERGLSPSRLETFATCGMRAFLSSILGVREYELPEENRGILAAERGTRVHEILERFGKAAKAAQLEPWPEADLDQLRVCLFDAIGAVIAKARFAAPDDQADLWDAEEKRYEGLLLGWLKAQRRDAGAWAPAEFEWRFEGVRFELAEAREAGVAPLYLRGVCDRVDLRRPGGEGGGLEARVVDYKTGKGTDVKDESAAFGAHLQLALYGAAARSQFGAAASTGLYDFVFFGKEARWSGRGKKQTKAAKWRTDTDETARDQVRVLVDAMEAGTFWPTPRKDGKPSDYGCKLCGVREACGPWREDAERVAADADPVLAALQDVMKKPEDEA